MTKVYFVRNKKTGTCSKLYTRLGFARGYLTRNKHYIYQHIDDYEIVTLTETVIEPAMSLITAARLLEVLKRD